MTTVAIMQPTYLGWLGLFDMLDQADVFVLLDTVAVSKQSWQTRNRIRARDGNVVWLSVPTNATPGLPLNEVQIDYGRDWHTKHWRTIESAYGHTPYLGEVTELLHQTKAWSKLGRLVPYTERWIREIQKRLAIDCLIVRACDLGLAPTGPVDRIAYLCNEVGATEYLSPTGAMDYLGGQDIGVPIRWHAYEHPVYDQGGAPFVSHLSVVDLLAWHGPDSLDVIRSGRNVPLHSEEGVCSWDIPRTPVAEDEAEAV